MQRARSHQQLRSKHHRSSSEPIDPYTLAQIQRTASAFAIPEQTGVPPPIIIHQSPAHERSGLRQSVDTGDSVRSPREKPSRCRRELALSFFTPRLLLALVLLLCALALLRSAAAAAVLWWQIRRRMFSERVEAFALPGTHLASSVDELESAPETPHGGSPRVLRVCIVGAALEQYIASAAAHGLCGGVEPCDDAHVALVELARLTGGLGHRVFVLNVGARGPPRALNLPNVSDVPLAVPPPAPHVSEAAARAQAVHAWLAQPRERGGGRRCDVVHFMGRLSDAWRASPQPEPWLEPNPKPRPKAIPNPNSNPHLRPHPRTDPHPNPHPNPHPIPGTRCSRGGRGWPCAASRWRSTCTLRCCGA